MEPDWKQYQEEVAQFFRNLGLRAETDITLNGVRTNHDVDVLVESFHKGIAIKWVVECKLWKDAVTKLHVLALREIVDDLGADRGFLLCEAGYQKGAREAAYLSNVQLTSLKDLSETCAQELGMMRVRKLFLRASELGERYWVLDKDVRIKHGLRGFVGGGSQYSGDRVVKAAKAALLAAMFHGFPVIYNEMEAMLDAYSGASAARQAQAYGLTPNRFGEDIKFDHPAALADYISDKLDELDGRLRNAEDESRPH